MKIAKSTIDKVLAILEEEIIPAEGCTEPITVEVKHLHTNITLIEKNGKVLLKQTCNDADFNSPLTDRKILTIKLIYNLAKSVDLELIKLLFEKVIKLNSAIAEVGLKETYGVNVGSCIMKSVKESVYGYDRKGEHFPFFCVNRPSCF